MEHHIGISNGVMSKAVNSLFCCRYETKRVPKYFEIHLFKWIELPILSNILQQEIYYVYIMENFMPLVFAYENLKMYFLNINVRLANHLRYDL